MQIQVYDVKMFECRSRNVISTFLGGAPDAREAKVACVSRAYRAKKVTYREMLALTKKIKHNVTESVDTNRWVFTIKAQVATSP